MSNGKTILVDLDGVICSEERTFERALAEPLPGARQALEKLRNAGHTIIVYTARGWAEYRMTKDWLDRHGIPYDAIQMGKPIGHVWIDDRAVRHRDWADTLRQVEQILKD